MFYELVIFDLDGTLLDTISDLADSLNHALALSGFPERSVEEVKSFVGNGIRRLIERGVPDTAGEAETDKVYRDFTEYYELHCADKTKPYAGVRELLCGLRSEGVLTAVVSNKADYAVQDLCRKYFDGLLDMAQGEREGVRRKPYPDSVNSVIERLGADRGRSIYIGDSEVDIETAENAGLKSIIVDWGFRDRGFLESRGAKCIVSSPEDILAKLVTIHSADKSDI